MDWSSGKGWHHGGRGTSLSDHTGMRAKEWDVIFKENSRIGVIFF